MLALYAALLLLVSYGLPWWRMEARAPQYGMRVLWVDIYAGYIEGDVKEIDGLGHYVGIRPMGDLAPFERAVAPFALGLAVLCALLLPFVRRGRLRLVLALVVIAVPIGFAVDLWYWQQWAVTHLDPQAPMSNIGDRMRAQLVGDYEVAQFKVRPAFETGFYLVTIAAANVLALLVVEGRRARRCMLDEGEREKPRSPAGAACALLALVPVDILRVGAGEPFSTVAGALEVAEPGDTILVLPGIYREHLVVDVPVILRGEAGAILDGEGAGTVVLVRAAHTTVGGFTVRGSGKSLLEEDAGIKLLGAADCVVEDNRVEDALFGIMARSAPRSTLLRNRVLGKDLPIPRQGDGIHVQDSSGSRIEDNEVGRSRDFVIWQSHGCVARRNVVRDGRYGLHYMYCDDNLFEDNVFDGNQTGGAIMYSRRVTLRGNRFAGSRGPSAHGLLVKVGDDIVAEGNWFVDNTSGLFVEDSPSSLYSSVDFRGNVFGGNEIGVSILSSAERVVFSGNVFVANRRQVQNLGRSRNEIGVWSFEGRGNYWDDYVGFDADGDGLGDTPHRLESFFEDLTERWPAVGLLRMGPAAQALEAAARAFPIVRPRPLLTDPFPLLQPPPELTRTHAPSRRPGLALAGFGALALSLFLLTRARSPAFLGGAA